MPTKRAELTRDELRNTAAVVLDFGSTLGESGRRRRVARPGVSLVRAVGILVNSKVDQSEPSQVRALQEVLVAHVNRRFGGAALCCGQPSRAAEGIARRLVWGSRRRDSTPCGAVELANSPAVPTLAGTCASTYSAGPSNSPTRQRSPTSRARTHPLSR